MVHSGARGYRQRLPVLGLASALLLGQGTFGSGSAMLYRTLRQLIPRTPQHWVGNGFYVHPVFNHLAFTRDVSPFLMLDYATPLPFQPTREQRGVGQHPHRGFETVTIAFQGQIEHADSMGNRGVIAAGDVQWMTAGRGIIHEEFHSREFAQQGGVLEMVQLWVNLPKAHKMAAPSYQPILSSEIPRVTLTADNAARCGESGSDEASGSCPAADLGEVRVIAGDFRGVQGPAKTFTPIHVWDIRLRHADEAVELETPADHKVMLLVRQGTLAIFSDGGREEQQIESQSLALLGDGSMLRIAAMQAATEVLLLSGTPIDEPIAAKGPFVMNTEAELRQAAVDFHSGRMGS